jgi:hypothetical protein
MSFIQEIAFEFRAEMSNFTNSLINPEKYVFDFPQKIYIALRVSHCVQRRFRFDKEINDRNAPQTYVGISINCFHFFRF